MHEIFMHGILMHGIFMINELIFFCYIFVTGCGSLIALRLGKEALVAFFTIQWILANLFITKQITIFGLNATTSDALIIGSALCLNLLNEYHGKKIAQKAILIGFIASIFYAIVSLLHISYVPNLFDRTHEHFSFILSSTPRIIIASLLAYLFSQEINVLIYSTLKKYASYTPIFIRNYVSIGISQFIDTILFSFLALYGIVHNIAHIIIVSYAIKLLIIAISAPFSTLSKYIFKEKNV